MASPLTVQIDILPDKADLFALSPGLNLAANCRAER